VSRPLQLVLVAAAVFAVALPATGCGDSRETKSERGAQLFKQRCSGCHTLTAAGAAGSVADQPPTGPNLDKRPETKGSVLYAIRNGGFSGAIMPQNVVVGGDAEQVAEFVAKYAGSDATAPTSPRSAPGAATGASGQSGNGSQ
jgi:mono/diheme cytochrome c family protein